MKRVEQSQFGHSKVTSRSKIDTTLGDIETLFSYQRTIKMNIEALSKHAAPQEIQAMKLPQDDAKAKMMSEVLDRLQSGDTNLATTGDRNLVNSKSGANTPAQTDSEALNNMQKKPNRSPSQLPDLILHCSVTGKRIECDGIILNGGKDVIKPMEPIKPIKPIKPIMPTEPGDKPGRPEPHPLNPRYK